MLFFLCQPLIKGENTAASLTLGSFCFRFSLNPQLLPVWAVCGFSHAKASFKCFHRPQKEAQSAFILLPTDRCKRRYIWQSCFPCHLNHEPCCAVYPPYKEKHISALRQDTVGKNIIFFSHLLVLRFWTFWLFIWCLCFQSNVKKTLLNL